MEKFLITLFATSLMLSVANRARYSIHSSGTISASAAIRTRICPGRRTCANRSRQRDSCFVDQDHRRKESENWRRDCGQGTQDMKTPGGEVLVPKDTKVMGHVTEAQPRNKEQKESQVGIAFDRP